MITFGLGLCPACVSSQGQRQEQKQTEGNTAADLKQMSLKQLATRVEDSNDRSVDIAAILTQRGEWKEAAQLVIGRLNQLRPPRDKKAARLIGLFATSPSHIAVQVFESVDDNAKPETMKAAWLLAAANPSPKMATAVSKRLSRKIAASKNPSSVIAPTIAKALAANNIVESYTLVRTSLNQSDNPEYVRAMANLEPAHASEDFATYLAKIPVNEIYSGNFLHSNSHTVRDILHHLEQNPPAIHHPNFEHLFFFAVSKDKEVAASANAVLDRVMPNHEEQMALVLTQLSVDVQNAYLERHKSPMSRSQSVFMESVKKNQKF